MEIASPEKFAVWFNDKYQDAYRKINAEDVRDMTTCGLIGRYRYYSLSQDGETVRGILQYEQVREKRSAQPTLEEKQEPPKCNMCGELLPQQPEGKKGRPREYCSGCESSRNKERYRRCRKRKKGLFAKSSSGGG